MSKYINLIDFLSNTLQIRRTSQFIGILGVTVRLKMINSSDETVHSELLLLTRGRLITIGRVRWSHVDAHYKMHRNRCCWIAIRHSWCVSVCFNLDSYNSCDNRYRLNAIRWTPIKAPCPSDLSEDQLDGFDCARSPACFKYSENLIFN